MQTQVQIKGPVRTNRTLNDSSNNDLAVSLYKATPYHNTATAQETTRYISLKHKTPSLPFPLPLPLPTPFPLKVFFSFSHPGVTIPSWRRGNSRGRGEGSGPPSPFARQARAAYVPGPMVRGTAVRRDAPCKNIYIFNI